MNNFRWRAFNGEVGFSVCNHFNLKGEIFETETVLQAGDGCGSKLELVSLQNVKYVQIAG